jgi:hypothetical protein
MAIFDKKIMSVTELKSKIIDHLNAIEDEDVLREIYELIASESQLASTYSLTEQERNAIEEGIKDLEEGNLYSSKQADDLLREWLKK